MKTSDWFPTKREKQITMAKNWRNVMGENLTLWNVTEDAFTKFCSAIDAFDKELSIPLNDRSRVSNARLRTACNELRVIMRDIKRRYFLLPPLDKADLIALGLKLKDDTPTAVGKPLGVAAANVKYLGKKVMQLYIHHVEGTPLNEKANYGYKIYYGVYADSETPPASGKDLRENTFTRKKKELFTFQPEDTGKTAYFCIRYENSKGEAGPWGQLLSAIIP